MRHENILEPHILERLAVIGYRVVGGEALWIPRLLSITFWLLGALFLYRIGVRLASLPSAALAVLFYLFMPFAILASRSFQPDPLMICLELAAILALLRFAEHENAARMLLAAGLCAMALLVKPVCLSVLLGVYGLGSLRRHGWRHTVTSRYTVMLLAIVSLPVAYYLWKMVWDTGDSYLAAQAEGSIIPALLLTGDFWCRVAILLSRVVGIAPLLLALVGLALIEERRPHQGVLAGMWLGYAAFVMVFTFHTHTHDYYHLQLLPIAALSLGPLVVAAFGVGKDGPWLTPWRLCLAGMALGALIGLGAAGVLYSRHALGRVPGPIKLAAKAAAATLGVPEKLLGFLRPASIGVAADVAAARAVGEAVQHSLHTVILGTHESTPLTYLGELSGVRWPSHGGLRASRLRGEAPLSARQRLQQLLDATPELEYFAITDFGDLARQPDLEQLLAGYPQVARGPGYAVYASAPDCPFGATGHRPAAKARGHCGGARLQALSGRAPRVRRAPLRPPDRRTGCFLASRA